MQKISHTIQTHHSKSKQNIAMKNTYVDNLPKDVTKQDIREFFGLNSTYYVRDTGNVNFPISNKTENLKAFHS